ncbi:fumarylacetoacetate hydrolase family protein [Buchananella felis]|uniref:fumarylacetoacetate hydrolase family protein n=1 Tax=Buchananella felis TaxID=3231492 RepID=UPI003528961F
MRIARFSLADVPAYGVLEPDSDRIVVLDGDPLFGGTKPRGEITSVDEVRLLSPVIPRSKVIGVAGNFPVDDAAAPAAPFLYAKPNTAVIGPDVPVNPPAWAGELHVETHLAVVIKSLCKNVAQADAAAVILGYTAAADFTSATAQDADGQWTRAKSWDTSCPLGPWIALADEFDPAAAVLRTYVDGQVVSEAKMADAAWDAARVVAEVSSVMTLLPGDVLLCGAPAPAARVKAGQRVDVEVSGIGSFSNPVIAL